MTGSSTQFGKSAPYVGQETDYTAPDGTQQRGYCIGYTKDGYPIYTGGTCTCPTGPQASSAAPSQGG
jgi:hypothetical protein